LRRQINIMAEIIQQPNMPTKRTITKLDLAKAHKAEYAAPRQPILIEIPKATYLSITGQGAPGGEEFSAKIGALYGVAYTIKMTRKFGGKQDYTISKLEAQYWGPDASQCFAALPKEQWRWKLFIRTPEFVTAKERQSAVKALAAKNKTGGADLVKLERMTEGLCVQMLHVGPYENEGKTAEIMQAFAQSQGLVLHGLPHDIYISDPRRMPPARLKTIMRHPVKKG
jgi:hypothetical protein